MNRRIHRQLLEKMSTLQQRHLIIKKNIEINNNEEVYQLLTECQNIAVEIGMAIENCEGSGVQTVTFLEEYSEAVYGLYENINSRADIVSEYTYMQSTYEKSLKSICDDLVVRLHIVFLPYKRAMWDSMESVWQAAKADIDCVAEVMPIPYFDKNADGSLGEMYCEAELYDFDVLDWEQHDLAEMQPDVIVVHNPYDQYNHVTTVHPYFYMKKLRQWTDKLVYIPYFVHQKDIVKEHYCVLPGTLYTDKVILQSEKVKKEYMEIFGEQTGIRSGLKQKFIALGSPKFDKDGRRQEIPEGWKPFLYSKDGKKKKVLFLNVHISYLMGQKADLFFRKMEKLFEIFKKQEEVVLLWRPHPLMLATVKSMNPGTVKKYENLVTQYKNEKVGIYDVTPDYHLALELADAYYGTGSSLVEIFYNSGKPIMRMNIQI